MLPFYKFAFNNTLFIPIFFVLSPRELLQMMARSSKICIIKVAMNGIEQLTVAVNR